MAIQAGIPICIQNDSSNTAALLRRVGWRILPLLIILYIIAFLDRVNIGFAASSMQRDLHFSDSLYGTGAGVFFLGYFIAQVPNNLALARFGARRTIAVLMVVWSLVSAATAFVHTPAEFIALRFLLGVAEAGFYPGVILYLTLWLPRRVRTSFTGLFLFGFPLASIIGGPLSTWILQRGSVGNLHSWQMLLLTQAAPAFLVGAFVPLLMADTPQQARWLSNEDRSALHTAWQADEPQTSAREAPNTDRARVRFGKPSHIAKFATIYFCMQVALYAQSFWLPKILQAIRAPASRIGWDVAIVYLIGAGGIFLWGRVADRAPVQRWTLAIPLAAGAAGFAATTIHTGNVSYIVAAFGLGAAGGLAATPPFWALVTLGQKSSEIAAMIAMINALGILGGFVGPALLGRLQQSSGSHASGMLVAATGMAFASALVFLRHKPASSPDEENKTAA